MGLRAKQNQANGRQVAARAAFALVAILGAVACSKGQSSLVGNDGAYISGIIGGTDATGDEDFAKTIAVVYNVNVGSLCTGSIISDQIVVTAAHCVDGAPASDLRVVFGTNLTKEAGGSLDVHAVIASAITPIYPVHGNDESDTGDIAVVRFDGGLPAGYRAATVLTDVTALQSGVTVMLAGYGISNGVSHAGAGVLRSVEVKIQDAAFSSSEILLDQTEGKGACHGDSGGPAYVKVGSTWMLWGVTSRGVNDPKNDCSVSAAYTSIPFYSSWIQKTANKLLKKAVPRPSLASAS